MLYGACLCYAQLADIAIAENAPECPSPRVVGLALWQTDGRHSAKEPSQPASAGDPCTLAQHRCRDVGVQMIDPAVDVIAFFQMAVLPDLQQVTAQSVSKKPILLEGQGGEGQHSLDVVVAPNEDPLGGG